MELNTSELKKYSRQLILKNIGISGQKKIFNSKILTPLNNLWIKFGELLGKIISPIIMSLLYFFVVTPIGFIMTILLKKDLLSTKFNKESSYWIKRAKNIGSMKKQF